MPLHPFRRKQNKQPSPQRRLKRTAVAQLTMAVGALVLVVALIFPMSVAWFTNVSRTGGIQFQAEAWGFDEEKITLPDDTTVTAMSPGKSGFVSLSVDNGDGTGNIRATVFADTSKLSSELQERVFFFVDKSETLADETVDKIYLSNAAPYGYTYDIPRGECLTLSESYYSDAPLKWEWVYDMEGYYFLGTVKADDSAEPVKIDSYLRPIEYPLEEAVFEEIENESQDENEKGKQYGPLVSIGERTVGEFLMELFDTDGYEGNPLIVVNGETKTSLLDDEGILEEDAKGTAYVEVNGKRYYRVSVNEDGYGVWAYLCDYDEIQAAQEYDQKYLEALTENMTATITVSVSNVESEAVLVSNANALKSALAEANADQTLTLTEDLTVAERLEVSGEAVVDLNGYAIVAGNIDHLFELKDGAKLTLLNGELSGTGGNDTGSTQTAAVFTVGSEVTVSGVKISGFDTAVYVDDRTAVNADSMVKLNGCTFDTKATSILIYGNGSASTGRTGVIVQNCTIQSGYIGISGQGTNTADDQRWGTELVVLQSTVTGTWAGIYQPQQKSTALISGSTVEGYTGLVVKGGTVNLYDTTVKGTGEYNDAKVSGGFTDTGGGVYVEAAYPWSATVILRGEGNEITSEKGFALELFGVEGKGPGRLVVEGGIFTGEKGDSKWNDIGTFSLPTDDPTQQD